MLYINSIVISYCRYCLQVISKHGRFDEKILKHFKIIFFLFNLINSSHVFHHFFRIFFCKVNFIDSLCLSIFLAGFNYFSNHMVRFHYDAAIYPLDLACFLEMEHAVWAGSI